ncbi:ATP-binding protein [Tamlana fucoidanivorans]|uniref:ATP-binding protein n=1 Tax=Allotamlana fucoidanivorans TaxID=2583814 RepID=A0A5C4SDM6_9FLAO|nr:ATP-binding protein [Tamlana fucoidanivorans]TNJ41676.1 ATP-binding protein [Tamlana fucoidanivorans]
MKFSQIIFNKDLYDLTYNDIVDFFNTEKEETLNLEFKSYPVQGNHNDKEKAVIKAICGLSNAEGGIVIWGAPIETTNPQGNTIAQGDLTPFETNLDRDRIINKISNLIIPLIVGVRVQKLDAPNGNSIFIIEVEKSKHKPHQYKDKYYIRLDGQTKIAPHYLIEAMMKSIDFPVIRGHIRLKNIELVGGNVVLSFVKVLFNTSEFNNDINFFYRIVAIPGIIRIGQNTFPGDYTNESLKIMSHGRPSRSTFQLIIPSAELIARGQEVDVVLNFGGEKSPSKVSRYKYLLNNIVEGDVPNNELPYLVEKNENELPSDVTNNSIDENINNLLDN